MAAKAVTAPTNAAGIIRKICATEAGLSKQAAVLLQSSATLLDSLPAPTTGVANNTNNIDIKSAPTTGVAANNIDMKSALMAGVAANDIDMKS